MKTLGRNPKARVELTLDEIVSRADVGNVACQERLIDLYYCAGKTRSNIRAAISWARKAATADSAHAQAFLGHAHFTGLGVRKDLKKAHYWYTKAASLGAAQAQTWLGYAYEKGIGVSKNLSKAMNFYRRAARKGCLTAQYNLGQIYNENKKLRNPNKAVTWWKKAALQGDAQAQCNLGKAFQDGVWVRRNMNTALFWYRKATRKDDSDVPQYNLGLYYAEGNGVRQDWRKAIKYFEASAALGFGKAIQKLQSAQLKEL